jgi:hypothetical protein
MTTLPALLRRRRPSPWSKLTRAQLEAKVGHIERQRDRALGEKRATRDWCASSLERRADAYDADARHMDRAVPGRGMPEPTLTALQRRALADALRDIAREFDEWRPWG